MLSVTDPLGTVTLNAYDGSGNLTSITRDYGRLNQLTKMSYSALGDVVSVTDPNGGVTSSTYDANRRVVTVTSPVTPAATQGLVTALGYDPDSRVIQTQQSVSGAVLTTRSASYSLAGKPVKAVDAKGNATIYTYDAVERLSSVKDAVGRLTSYGYDTMSRRTAVFNLAIQTGAIRAQAYTPDGLMASLTDANSNTTSFAYDGFDRLSTTTYPGSSTETLTYDSDGNVLSRTTRGGQTIAFTYDTLNRLATKTPPSSAPVVTYSYDLAGRVIGVSDTSSSIAAAVPPSGASVQYATTATYDALNRPLGFTWTQAQAQSAPTSASVTFTHGYEVRSKSV